MFCEPTPTSRKETCDEIAQENGYQIIHPYDNYSVIAGQATIAYEMLNIQNEVHEFHHKVVGKKIGGSGAKPPRKIYTFLQH